MDYIPIKSLNKTERTESNEKQDTYIISKRLTESTHDAQRIMRSCHTESQATASSPGSQSEQPRVDPADTVCLLFRGTRSHVWCFPKMYDLNSQMRNYRASMISARVGVLTNSWCEPSWALKSPRWVELWETLFRMMGCCWSKDLKMRSCWTGVNLTPNSVCLLWKTRNKSKEQQQS